MVQKYEYIIIIVFKANQFDLTVLHCTTCLDIHNYDFTNTIYTVHLIPIVLIKINCFQQMCY